MKRPLQSSIQAAQTAVHEASVPAPVGGLNSRDPLAQMKPTDALVLDNFLCKPTSVDLRKGLANFVTGFTANDVVWSLHPYRAAPNDKMFAATDLGVYDVTATGVLGAIVSPSTNGKWESINGSNSGIHYLLMVNGTDPMKFYNGTVWADAAITALDSTKITNISQFKFRVFFTVKDSLSFWYLAVNAVQGAATEFPLAPIFVRGGSLLACGSWTIDGGNGSDDYAVFITTEGEIAIYKGTDPSNAATWAMVGVYQIARPIGRKCLFKYGGDVLIITESGIFPLSKSLQAASLDRTIAVSDKIIGAISSAASAYKAQFGWQLVLLSSENVLILNVPLAQGSLSVQFAMNTLTGAWSMLKGINAACFLELGSRLFYGMKEKVCQALTGQNDFGANITFRAQTSYNNFGQKLKTKQTQLIRPNFSTSKIVQLNLAVGVNYAQNLYATSGSTNSNNAAQFDLSFWDQAYWAGSDYIVATWRSVPHKPGYALSLVMQVTDKDYAFYWNSTDHLLSIGSAFG